MLLAPASAGVGRGPAIALGVALALVIGLAGFVGLGPAGVGLVGAPPLALAGAPVVVDAERHVVLEEYGRDGSQVIGYAHGERVTVRLALVNRGLAPVTIETLDAFPVVLGMLATERVLVDGRVLPVRLGPRAAAEIEVTGRFGNCEYFTERAIDTYDHALVTVAGVGGSRVAVLAYADQLLVRSPAIVDCPDRVLDRGAKQRGAEGTITGRG